MKIYAAMSSGFVPAAHVDLLKKAEELARHRLFSYHYHGATSPDNEPSMWVRQAYEQGCSMFLDSGAFSAFHTNSTIDIDKYAEFIHKTEGMWEVVANLDIIGGSEEANWDNLKALESNGCKVSPVYHVGENPRWLYKMLDEYEYILLGGLVMARKSVMRELDRAFRILTYEDGSPRAKFHGFGLTQLDLVFRYPWYSVDSTSWMLSAGFGSCVLYDGTTKFLQIVFSDDSPSRKSYYAGKSDAGHFERLDEVRKQKVLDLIRPSGITVEQLKESYVGRRVLNLWAYRQLENMEDPKFKGAILDLGLF